MNGGERERESDGKVPGYQRESGNERKVERHVGFWLHPSIHPLYWWRHSSQQIMFFAPRVKQSTPERCSIENTKNVIQYLMVRDACPGLLTSVRAAASQAACLPACLDPDTNTAICCLRSKPWRLPSPEKNIKKEKARGRKKKDKKSYFYCVFATVSWYYIPSCLQSHEIIKRKFRK